MNHCLFPKHLDTTTKWGRKTYEGIQFTETFVKILMKDKLRPAEGKDLAKWLM